MSRNFSVSSAYYINNDDELIEISGVPEYNKDYYGKYTGDYPYQGATKAFTGLQKHMKKFNMYDDIDWFPGYDENHPPEIVFKMVDTDTLEEFEYYGVRKPSPQGQRTIVNNDGRVREYKWVNHIQKLELDQD